MNRFHALIFAIAASCGLSAAAQSPLRFTTTDTTLQRTFDWARDMALSYVHDGSGPVGLWYEAALPGRDAFCMRDVSHQVVGRGYDLLTHAMKKNRRTLFATLLSHSEIFAIFVS